MEGIAFIVMPFQSNAELYGTLEHMSLPHPPYYTPPAPKRSEDNILNTLNDDCLAEIFRRMDKPLDRIEIERVCSRFKHVAGTASTSALRKQTISFNDLNPDGRITLQEIEQFLQRYGESILSVDLLEELYEHIADSLNSILRLMSKHCPNLKRLSLSFAFKRSKGIEMKTLIEMRPLLSKLSSFSITHSSLSVCNAFVAACDELEKLSVSVLTTEYDSFLPEIHFSKLRNCTFRHVSNAVVNGFLAENPQIEELEMQYDFDAWNLVPEKLPKLQKLTLDFISVPLTDLDCSRLKNMPQTKIAMRWKNSQFLLPDSILNLCEITNIAALDLTYFINIDFDIIVELTKHLCNLETLDIRRYTVGQILRMDKLKEMLLNAKKLTRLAMHWLVIHEFSEKDYNEILQIVKGRGDDPVKLTIELTNCRYLFHESTSKKIFLNAEPRWLTIINYYNY